MKDTKTITRTFFWLSIAAGALTIVGVLFDIGLRYTAASDVLLSYYPRYTLAMRGFHILEEMKYPFLNGPTKQQMTVGVLPIEDRSWPIMVGFLRSDTAFLKSPRNDPPHPKNQPSLPAVNWERIKTIVSVKSDVPLAGDQPLMPPYSLDVLWPGNAGRVMYEFRSWDEFRLDLRETMLQRLETTDLWITLTAVVCTILAESLRRIVERKRSTPTASE